MQRLLVDDDRHQRAPRAISRRGGASSCQFNRRTGTSLLRSLTYVGKARALAVTSTMRSDSLPDIPPMSDVLPGFKSISWFSVGATKNTAKSMSDRESRSIL